MLHARLHRLLLLPFAFILAWTFKVTTFDWRQFFSAEQTIKRIWILLLLWNKVYDEHRNCCNLNDPICNPIAYFIYLGTDMKQLNHETINTLQNTRQICSLYVRYNIAMVMAWIIVTLCTATKLFNQYSLVLQLHSEQSVLHCKIHSFREVASSKAK